MLVEISNRKIKNIVLKYIYNKKNKDISLIEKLNIKPAVIENHFIVYISCTYYI